MNPGFPRRLADSGTSIRTRMTLSMLSAAALILPVILVATFYIRQMNDAVSRIVGQDIELMHVSDRISLTFLDARRGEKNFLLFQDSSYLVENRAALEHIERLCLEGRGLAPELVARFDTITLLTAGYRGLVDSLVGSPPGRLLLPDLERLREHHQSLLDAAEAAVEPARRDSLLAAARQLATEVGLPAVTSLTGWRLNERIKGIQTALSAQTDSIGAIAKERIQVHQNHARRLAAWGQRNIATALLVVLVVLGWLVVTLPRRAVLPVKRIINAIRRVEEGDLDVRVKLRSRDELGELGRQLNRVFARLRAFDDQKSGRIYALERRFRLLLQDISEGVLVVDKVPNIVLSSPAMEPLLDCRAAEAQGRKLRSFPNLSFLYEPLEKVLAGATSSQTCEIPAELPGTVVCIEALRDKAGNITGALVVVTNPTPPQPSADEAADSPAQT